MGGPNQDIITGGSLPGVGGTIDDLLDDFADLLIAQQEWDLDEPIEDRKDELDSFFSGLVMLKNVCKKRGIDFRMCCVRGVLQEEIKRQLVAAGADAERVRNHYANASSVGALHGRMLRDKAMNRMLELASHRDVEVEESDIAASMGSR